MMGPLKSLFKLSPLAQMMGLNDEKAPAPAPVPFVRDQEKRARIKKAKGKQTTGTGPLGLEDDQTGATILGGS